MLLLSIFHRIALPPYRFVYVSLITLLPSSLNRQYDQCGIMVRLSEGIWLKTSIEFEGDEPARLGAVVTKGGFSDWSTQDVPSSVRYEGFF